MPGATLFSLLDDIASLMNNVTTVATKATAATADATAKTIALTGDDAAVMAEQVLKIPAERENAVITKIRNGSFFNKAAMILPAMAIGAFAPWAMTPLLMAGGAWLCYEGMEKVLHGNKKKPAAPNVEAAIEEIKTYEEFEASKIKGALRTDRVMSAEIMAMALSSVMKFDPLIQFLALAGAAFATTVIVYEPVRGLLRMDDTGLRLQQSNSESDRKLGKKLIDLAPKILNAFSYIGVAATFLVGGGLLASGIPGATEMFHSAAHAVSSVPGIGGALETIVSLAAPSAAGLLGGGIIVALEKTARGLYGIFAPAVPAPEKAAKAPDQRAETSATPAPAPRPAMSEPKIERAPFADKNLPPMNGSFADAAQAETDKAASAPKDSPALPLPHTLPPARKTDNRPNL